MQNDEPDNEEFRSLMEGNRRFMKSGIRFKELADSQSPEYIVVGCSDSRVHPSIIADSGLGSIFEIRVAGEVLDQSSIGSIEFGVKSLNTRKIVVMGHSSCGAVTAAHSILVENSEFKRDGSGLSMIINDILGIISSLPQGKRSLEECIRENVRGQIRKLVRIPEFSSMVEAGRIQISGAYYDISTGKLEMFQ